MTREKSDVADEHVLSRRTLLSATAGSSIAAVAGCTEVTSDSESEAVRLSLAGEATDGEWDAYGGVVPYYTPFQETLTAAPPTLGEPEPQLATEWETVDETTWQFTLREGVTFHDDTELTASVAAESLSALIEARPIGFTRFRPDSFSATDEYTLEIETTQPEPATPGNLAHPLLSLQHPDADDPVGTGPYVAERVEDDEPVETSIYEGYWGNTASTELVFEGTVDPQTRSLSLEDGETDVGIDLPRGSYDQLQDHSDVTVRTETEPRTGMVMINRYRDATSDRQLRRGLLHAVDQYEIVEELFDGIGEPAHAPFSKVISWSAHDELPPHTDLERAEELVESSSYDGESLRFIVTGGEDEQRLIAEEIQRRCGQIGVDIEIDEVEPSAFFSEYTGGESDLAFVELGSINGAADYLVYVMYHSEGGDNRAQFESEGTGVVNPGEEVDELIDRGDTAFDRDEKEEAYREVQRRVMEDAVTIPIYYKEYVFGTRAEIDGPDLHAIPHMTDWTTLSR